MTAAKRPSESLRFLQFTLRELFLLVTVVAVLAAILGWRSRPALQRLYQQAANRRLLASARDGNLEGTTEAIAAGADRWTRFFALKLAIENNEVPTARLLLDVGTELESPFRSLTRVCIEPGRIEMLELLLHHGAEATSGDLIAAIEIDQPADTKSRMISLLLSHGADIEAALDSAARRRDVSLANVLRQYGASFTPRVVAELGLLDDLSRLVAEDPSILRKRFTATQPGGLRGETTLVSIALERADREMARFLLDAGAPVDDVVYNGCTLLHSAAIGGDPELVSLLIDRGLDLNAKSDGGITPLFLAIRIGHAAAAAVLIDSGADVNVRSSWGTTPLIEAVAKNGRRIVELLLAAGADPSVAGRDGRTPYDLASDKRNADILNLLEQKSQAEMVDSCPPSDGEY